MSVKTRMKKNWLFVQLSNLSDTEIGKDTRDQRPDSYKFPDGSGGLPSWAENRLTRINVPSNSFNGISYFHRSSLLN